MREFRQCLRRLRSQPGPMLVAVLALALGIGFTGAMFSIIDGSLLRGLPVEDPENLVRIERRSLREGGVSAAEFQAWSAKQTSFSQLVAWFGFGVVFSRDGRPPDSYDGAYVSAQFFDALGVQPQLGRVFLPEEDQENGPPVVVVSDALWRRRYQGDPKVLGRTVWLGGDNATIVGVMPAGFEFPVEHEFWRPLGNVLSSVTAQGTPLDVFGRFRSGMRAGRAQAELDALARGPVGPAAPGDEVRVTAYSKAYSASARGPLFLLFAAVSGVLAIACANVANLLLARGLLRERELAARVALGAGGRALAAPVVMEAVLLACFGALAGLGVAKACIDLYNSSGGLVHASWVDVRLDPRALVFVAGITLLAAVLSGLLPALRAARLDAGSLLKDHSQPAASRRSGRVGRLLVAGQVALSCALLSGTGQMVASVRNLDRQDVGEAPEKVWLARVIFNPERWPTVQDWLRFYAAFTRDIAAVPGVRSVALVSHPPATPTPRTGFVLEGVAERSGSEAPSLPTVRWSMASPGLFATLGRPVLRGRDFLPTDTAGSLPVAVVNKSFVARHFGDRDPIGRRFRLEGQSFQGSSWLTVVGVVPDLYLSWDYFSDRIDLDHPEGIYLPLAQKPLPGGGIVLRSDLSAPALEAEVRKVLGRLDPEVPPLHPTTLAENIATASADYRRMRAVLAALGAAGLLLAGLGLHGLAAFVSGQQLQAIAVHRALGAEARDVLTLLARSGGLQIGLGAVAGAALAMVTSRLLRTFLFGVEPQDFTSLAGALLLLVLVGVMASFHPARRALCVDPASVLRHS